VEVGGAEEVVLRVVDGIKASVERKVFVFAGKVTGSSVRPGGGVAFNVLDNGL